MSKKKKLTGKLFEIFEDKLLILEKDTSEWRKLFNTKDDKTKKTLISELKSIAKIYVNDEEIEICFDKKKIDTDLHKQKLPEYNKTFKLFINKKLEISHQSNIIIYNKNLKQNLFINDKETGDKLSSIKLVDSCVPSMALQFTKQLQIIINNYNNKKGVGKKSYSSHFAAFKSLFYQATQEVDTHEQNPLGFKLVKSYNAIKKNTDDYVFVETEGGNKDNKNKDDDYVFVKTKGDSIKKILDDKKDDSIKQILDNGKKKGKFTKRINVNAIGRNPELTPL